jgi:hypothetical protein
MRTRSKKRIARQSAANANKFILVIAPRAACQAQDDHLPTII